MSKKFLVLLAWLITSTLVISGCRGGASPTGTPEPDEAVKSEDLNSGISMAYVEAGPEDAPVLILLHGFTDSSLDWSLVIPYLEDDFRVYALDLRGHGDSEAPQCCYTIPDMAYDVVAFMDALDIPKASVAGFSMGSLVAQNLAIDYPERVDKLVLVSSTDTGVGNEGLLWTWDQILTFKNNVPDDFLDAWNATANPVDSQFIADMRDVQKATPLHVWRGAGKMLLTHDHSAFLGDIEIPTLILWGDQDSFFSITDQERLINGLAHETLKTYVGTGHNIPWEIPDKAARDMRAFLLPSP